MDDDHHLDGWIIIQPLPLVPPIIDEEDIDEFFSSHASTIKVNSAMADHTYALQIQGE